MGYETLKMCIINGRFQDKKPLSQKLIVRNSCFHEFGDVKCCVITHVYWTVLLQQHHLACLHEITRLNPIEIDATSYPATIPVNFVISCWLSIGIFKHLFSTQVEYGKQYLA